MLEIRRTQYAVGQGFFHSSEIRSLDPFAPAQFAFAYDCGTSSERSAMHSAISAHVSTLRPRHLNMLFLSHIHDDHINGVESLLVTVRTDVIVIPKTSPVERLLLFARAGAPRLPFVAAMAIDPVLTLASAAPTATIVILGSAEDGQDPFDNEPQDLGPVDPGDGLPWKYTGRSYRSRDDESTSGRVVEAKDDGEFFINSNNERWTLIPYVQPGKVDEKTFIAELARKLKVSIKEMERHLESRTFREQLVTKDVDALQSAYALTARNLNFTSLMLYSGPTRADVQDAISVRPRCAWLGTGDGRLSSKAAMKPFLARYNSVKAAVSTLSIPHHGARPDSNFDFYAEMQPTTAVAAVANPALYGHPSLEVMREAGYAGAFVKLVTQEPATAFCERLLYEKDSIQVFFGSVP